MSKAFTRESDDEPGLRVSPRLSSALPLGAKNYVTEDGARRFRDELEKLAAQRFALNAFSEDAEAREQLRGLDQRLADLEQILETAEVVPTDSEAPGEVHFGTRVTVRERDGIESEYRIVGVDEIDIDRGWVSWLSPIARALMNARIGERVTFKFPAGQKELEVVAIAAD